MSKKGVDAWFPIYDIDGLFVALCKRPEDACAMAILLGGTVRHPDKSRILWDDYGDGRNPDDVPEDCKLGAALILERLKQ